MLPMADRQHGSSRLRAWQYVPHLERAGFEVRAVNRLERLSAASYSLAVLRGILWCDLVFIQKRFFPGWLLRVYRTMGKKVVYDFDDAIFLSPDGSPSPHVRRLESCLRAASCVIAGNSHLAEYARRFNSTVHILPTPVPMSPLAPRARTPGRFVLGWIGTKSTVPDLESISEALREASRRLPELVLKVITAEPVKLEGVRIEFVPWKLETAESELRSADVGIMPLRNNPFTLGKCAYKALQCMALGMPVIVTPYGMSAEVVADGREGLWASGQDEWVRAISRLHGDPEAVGQMGLAAYDRARAFGVEPLTQRLLDVLHAGH